MKKITSVLISLAVIMSLTACSTEKPLTNTTSTSGNSSSSASSSIKTTPDTSSSTDTTPSNSSSPVQQVSHWEEDLIGADGEPLPLSDAVIEHSGAGDEYVMFNYSIIEYAPPIYDDTFKNPDLINWETNEFASHDYNYTPVRERVKAGDVLDNGLKVKEARHILEYFIDDWVDYTGWVYFDGELTLNGALYCVPEDDYIDYEGDLYFFPDTTNFSHFPDWISFISDGEKEYDVPERVYPDAGLAVVGTSAYRLGNISELGRDDIIEKGKAAEVTVTIKNIRIVTQGPNSGGGAFGCFGEIVSIEKINN